MAYKVPPSASPDDDAIGVLATILSSGRSARFYESIVRQKQLSTGVSAFTGESRGPGLFRIIGTVLPGKTLTELEAAIDGNRAAGTADRGLGDREGANQRQAGVRQWHGQHAQQGHSVVAGRCSTTIRPPQHAEACMAKVTAADVQRVARQYLVKTGRTVVLTVPKVTAPK
jgi:zinc protease